MSKLDWAKANRAEMPKVARKKTETQKRQEAVAKAYANGTAREQERIIKLLEEARDKCVCYRKVGMPICRHQLSVNEQIALIKGEQK